MKWFFAVVAGIIAVAVLGFLGTYNGQVSGQETALKAVANIQVQLKRRTDLIPNLVNAVKGAMTQEREVLDAVVKARASATQIKVDAGELVQNPELMQKFLAAQNQVGASLGRLIATMERYPVLKSLDNVSQLQAQLEGTENRIGVARTRMNEAVASYNKSLRTLPFGQMVASWGGFQPMPRFKAAPADTKVPQVKLN